MVSEDRQRVIETNRSLRNIKNELEALLEKGVINEAAFDSIHQLLPAEASLSGAPPPSQRANTGLPTPSATPVAAAPPSYAQSTGNGNGGPPPLPGRNPPPAAAPGKPVLIHGKALYKYAAQDTRDCSFEKGDRLAVYEYMNADWWMGRNLRTGQEGIFPKAYVEPESAAAAESAPTWGGDEKQRNAYGAVGFQPPPGAPQQQQQQYGGGGAYPPPPGQVNPYNAHAPPMAMANNNGEPSKTEQNGKKFGKKLGNAAIFGAGATIGGKIVNSIF